MTQDSSTYWKKSRVELRAAGFDPDRTAETNAVVTIASAYTNAHRCNNRVRSITDLLVELIAERGGQGLIVGAPAVSDALTQGTPTAGYSLVSRDVVADCFGIGHYAHHGDARIGMMMRGGASHPADFDARSDIHADVRAQARASVDALYRLIAAGIRPLDIMTERAFENAITTVYAMGGSTNMYLHLLAIARQAQVPITIERIQEVGQRIPLLAHLQPHGPYAMTSLHAIGRVPI